MLERYDQSELLGLIEGDLDARAAAALRARLAKDPQVASMIESMIQDRAALRSMEEPTLPHDFLIDIEPMLSRPMLYESAAEAITTKPGEFRRQQQRQSRRMRWGRIAAAAVLLLAATGGGWALVRSMSGEWSNPTNDLLAAAGSNNDGASDTMRSTQPRSGRSNNAPAPGTIAAVTRDELGPGAVHHDRPPRHIVSDATPALAPALANARSKSADIADSPNANSGQGEPMIVAADFAVVMQSPNATIAETSVSGAIADLGERAALVRNFSYVEAQKLNEEYRIAHGGGARGGSDTQPMVADSSSGRSPNVAANIAPNIAPGITDVREHSITRSELNTLARNVREQLRSRNSGGETPSDPAMNPSSARQATLAGAEKLAPTLEQQLDFSSRGAMYTLAVPASEVVALLERLALNDTTGNAAMMLRMMPTTTTDADATDGSAGKSKSGAKPQAATLDWLTEGPLVRQAMQRLAQARGDTIVLVPVMIK